METFLCVAICFALVALGLAVGVIINHSQKSTFENYFSAVLAEMMELNRRVENLSIDLDDLKIEVYTEALPVDEQDYEEDDSGNVTLELPKVDSDGWEWR